MSADGQPTYVEHHRTVGDWVRDIVSAGFGLTELVEPEWPAGLTAKLGRLVAAARPLMPGTAIFVCDKPGG